MIQLTQDQSQALKSAELPPRAFDPFTSNTYVLIPNEVYERAKSILVGDEEEFANALHRQAMEAFGRDGWDDPAMDVYNDLDPRRQS